MENTFTFTARSADDSHQVTTVTLHDHRLSVGSGPPVEQLERASGEQPADLRHLPGRLWLRPLLLSFLQRESGAFPISDVEAAIEEDYLLLRAWLRAGGLRALRITLVDDRVDNPQAAQAFFGELMARQEDAGALPGMFEPLDYWATWILAALASLVAAVLLWRRHRHRR